MPPKTSFKKAHAKKQLYELINVLEKAVELKKRIARARLREDPQNSY